VFKFYPQHNQMDCGPACLQMLANHYGRKYSLSYLREKSYVSKNGVSLLGITDAATLIGFRTLSAKLNINQFIEKAPLPCILHWNQNHFVVLYDIEKKNKNIRFRIADPGHGLLTMNKDTFVQNWITEKNEEGVALFLQPSDMPVLGNGAFGQISPRYQLLYKYLSPFKGDFFKLFLTLLTGSILTLILPFLTQILIDKGVGSGNLHLSFIILLAQLFLFLGTVISEVIRNQVLLVMGTRVGIVIMSDFLKKLMSIPLFFFDTKLMGDFNQRIQDQGRIESFLTSQGLLTFFSLLNFLVFFVVLGFYKITILLVYLLLTIISIFWIYYFLGKRKILDYVSFQYKAESKESTFEILNGIHEIKLNDYAQVKTSQWEKIQINLFKVNQKALVLDQYQAVGYNVINQVKNIVVMYLVVKGVIRNEMTLGAMLSVSYIMGQMNGPLTQLLSFIRSFQDAKISLDRLEEIHNEENEEKPGQLIPDQQYNGTEGIVLSDLSFRYAGPRSPLVIDNISIHIPKGKTLAIVGASGSGKTTLMKLLLKFYDAYSGYISVEESNLATLSSKYWRKRCGAVLQDGYIFSDTIENNIVTGNESLCIKKLTQAVEIANLTQFIAEMPLGFQTRVGAGGNGLSGGQKQRILIARAIYKNPDYLFFDEATSSLDAANEKVIVDNLNHYLLGRTAVVIAHRLSTVKKADHIVVMDCGKIAECGTHEQLVLKKGLYFELIKNQLELGD
jgi:ATP-binding cassette subfamily B protein